MAKLHVELDGPVASMGMALVDGEPQPNVVALFLGLDANDDPPTVAIERAIVVDGRVYLSTEHHVITKLTISAEIQEVQ